MNATIRPWRAVQVTLVAVGTLLAGDFALSQQATTEVVIAAERPVTKVVGRTSTGVPVEVTTISRRVSYADLDLASHAGATELENRVNVTAKDLCKQLDKLYPISASSSESRDCVRKATDQAMEQVRVAVAAASSRASGR